MDNVKQLDSKSDDVSLQITGPDGRQINLVINFNEKIVVIANRIKDNKIIYPRGYINGVNYMELGK